MNCGTRGGNARMGFLPDRDTGAGGTSISLKVAYRRHFQTQPPRKSEKAPFPNWKTTPLSNAEITRTSAIFCSDLRPHKLYFLYTSISVLRLCIYIALIFRFVNHFQKKESHFSLSEKNLFCKKETVRRFPQKRIPFKQCIPGRNIYLLSPTSPE